jgi:hypothetical protein
MAGNTSDKEATKNGSADQNDATQPNPHKEPHPIGQIEASHNTRPSGIGLNLSIEMRDKIIPPESPFLQVEAVSPDCAEHVLIPLITGERKKRSPFFIHRPPEAWASA